MKEWKTYSGLTARLSLVILQMRPDVFTSLLAIEFSRSKNTPLQTSGIMLTPSQIQLITPLEVSTLNNFPNQVGLLDQPSCGKIRPIGPYTPQMKPKKPSRFLKMILKSRKGLLWSPIQTSPLQAGPAVWVLFRLPPGEEGCSSVSSVHKETQGKSEV